MVIKKLPTRRPKHNVKRKTKNAKDAVSLLAEKKGVTKATIKKQLRAKMKPSKKATKHSKSKSSYSKTMKPKKLNKMDMSRYIERDLSRHDFERNFGRHKVLYMELPSRVDIFGTNGKFLGFYDKVKRKGFEWKSGGDFDLSKKDVENLK